MAAAIGSYWGASMEPRFFKRGNGLPKTLERREKRASMEPRFFKRGNVARQLFISND